MSKSKKNTIDPEKIIDNYGADSVRLFMLADSPPEKDIQWSDEGINSSYKFIQKLWILNKKIIEEIEANHPSNPNNDLEKITNKFIKEITHNIENFSYNKIIANFHETYSALNKIILTTEKDFGRLRPKINNRDIYYIEVGLKFPKEINEYNFDKNIEDYIFND